MISTPFHIDKISMLLRCPLYVRKNNGRPHISQENFGKMLEGVVKYQELENCRIYAFKRMWWATQGESVVVVKHNRMTHNGILDPSVLYLEYNPNKTHIPYDLLQFLKDGFYVTEIPSIDLAFDIPDTRVEDILFTAPSHSNTMSYGSLGNASTRYLHPKANHGRIKVYDKYAERKAAKRRYDYIDAEKYQGITRIEFTFHNLGYLLADELDELSVIRAQEVVNFLCQVQVKHSFDFGTGVSISPLDQFVIDNFMSYNPSLAEDYINHKGINQRKNLKAYMRSKHYAPIAMNGVNGVFDFHRNFKKVINKTIPKELL